MTTFSEAVEAYLEANKGYPKSLEPMVTGLRQLAAVLDRKFSAAVYAQYGLTYRHLHKHLGSEVEIDEVERELESGW